MSCARRADDGQFLGEPLFNEPSWVSVDMAARHHTHNGNVDVESIEQLTEYRQIAYAGDPAPQPSSPSHHGWERAPPSRSNQAQQPGGLMRGCSNCKSVAGCMTSRYRCNGIWKKIDQHMPQECCVDLGSPKYWRTRF